jgi:hypothetical protein
LKDSLTLAVLDSLNYQFELGFGTGENFVRSSTGDGLDFDTPDRDPEPSSARFTIIGPHHHSEDLLRFSDGLIPHGSTDAYTFSIDVPDFNPNLMPDSARLATEGSYRFTLRQTPNLTFPDNGETPAVADGGATGLLGLLALGSMATFRRFMRR